MSARPTSATRQFRPTSALAAGTGVAIYWTAVTRLSLRRRTVAAEWAEPDLSTVRIRGACNRAAAESPLAACTPVTARSPAGTGPESVPAARKPWAVLGSFPPQERKQPLARTSAARARRQVSVPRRRPAPALLLLVAQPGRERTRARRRARTR